MGARKFLTVGLAVLTAIMVRAGVPVDLFNGKDLSGWYKFLQGHGRDNDPRNAIGVTNGVIRMTGETWGALVTEREYSNYRLTVEYRFDGTRFPSKEESALASGILFHSVGEDGGFAGAWMPAHEYELIQGASGDLRGVHLKGAGMSFTGSVNGEENTILGNDRIPRFDIGSDWTNRRDVPLAWNERPVGQWNVAVLECRGDAVLCYFNGRLVNYGRNFTPSKGRIQLQSEGCGVEFRRVTIESLADDRPWLSLEELLRTRLGYYQIDMQLGAPEKDAKRFYRDPCRRSWVDINYDESQAGELGKDYALEDPLTFVDGRRVTTAAEWEGRRAEILRIFEREVYGVMPPKPDFMDFDLISEKLTEDRFAFERHYRQYFRRNRSGPVIDWVAFVPVHAKNACPVILHLNYNGNDQIAAGSSNHYFLPLSEMRAHDCVFMSACYEQITADNGTDETAYRLFDGVYELWGARDPKRTDLTGALMAWAWGLCRGLDLAERIPEVDAKRNMVIGWSRLGKAALLAAAYDIRFSVCIPNQTGAVGVQLMKRNYGETIQSQALAFPHWYCPAVWKYKDDPRKMPFDQHLLLACVAPRALLLECYHKKWFDPKGEFLAAKAASPVWEFLTGKGLGQNECPEPYSDVGVRPPFGYVRRTECHGLSPYDWKWAFEFAFQVWSKR